MSVELDLKPLESQTVAAVKEIFGCRLRCVLVYESAVWGKFNHEADIQIRVLAELQGTPPFLYRGKIAALASELCSEYELAIKLDYMDYREFYQYSPFVPFYQTLLEQGIEWYSAAEFQLNRNYLKHGVFSDEGLYVLTAKKLESLKNDVISGVKSILGEKLDKIILFGSYARGDFQASSDVDIMLLGDVSATEKPLYNKQLQMLISRLILQYNCMEIELIFRTLDQYNQKDALCFAIQREGKIWYERA